MSYKYTGIFGLYIWYSFIFNLSVLLKDHKYPTEVLLKFAEIPIKFPEVL